MQDRVWKTRFAGMDFALDEQSDVTFVVDERCCAEA